MSGYLWLNCQLLPTVIRTKFKCFALICMVPPEPFGLHHIYAFSLLLSPKHSFQIHRPSFFLWNDELVTSSRVCLESSSFRSTHSLFPLIPFVSANGILLKKPFFDYNHNPQITSPNYIIPFFFLLSTKCYLLVYIRFGILCVSCHTKM